MLNQTEFRSTENKTVPVPTPSPYKTFAFAIAIIIGIGGLVTASVGLAAFYNVGTFSSLSQVQAISMMGVGGFTGHSLIVVAIACLLKKPQTMIQQPSGSSVHATDKNNSQKITKQAISSSSSVKCGVIYGPADFEKAFKVKIVGKVPPAPEINWDANDPYFNNPLRENYVLFYIPAQISVADQVRDFDLQTFKQLSDAYYDYFTHPIIEQFGNKRAAGWVLMSKTNIPDSTDKDYATQKNMVEMHKSFQMTGGFEACLLNLLVYISSHVKLYEDHFVRCSELVHNGYAILVGKFGADGLTVRASAYVTPIIGVGVMMKC